MQNCKNIKAHVQKYSFAVLQVQLLIILFTALYLASLTEIHPVTNTHQQVCIHMSIILYRFISFDFDQKIVIEIAGIYRDKILYERTIKSNI